MVTPRRYYLKLTAAWVRGQAARGLPVDLPSTLRETPLDALDAQQLAAIVAQGEAVGLAGELPGSGTEPLVALRVLQWLRRMEPASLLDVGSGALFWPILDALPRLPVAAVPRDADAAAALDAVARGGWPGLMLQPPEIVQFPRRAFDVVLALDGLQGMPLLEEAVLDLVGWARRAVFLATANRESDWPEPRAVNLLHRSGLTALLTAAGAVEVTIDVVGDHLLAVGWLSPVG